jgi:hypothetical protein
MFVNTNQGIKILFFKINQFSKELVFSNVKKHWLSLSIHTYQLSIYLFSIKKNPTMIQTQNHLFIL